MTDLGRKTRLRACDASDDAFLHDVFCTTWASEVAALPNQNLAQHVLRIQHIAQERRFSGGYPGHQRFVILEDQQRAGRLYVHANGPTMHVVDLTIMPEFRSRGIGRWVFRNLFDQATHYSQSVTLRLSRREPEANGFSVALGFRLVDMDDLDNFLEWTPSHVEVDGMEFEPTPFDLTKEGAARRKEGPVVHSGAEA